MRTTGCRAGGMALRISSVICIFPASTRVFHNQCSAVAAAACCLRGSGSVSQAARASQNSVSPPSGGTTRAESMDHLVGSMLNELSV